MQALVSLSLSLSLSLCHLLSKFENSLDPEDLPKIRGKNLGPNKHTGSEQELMSDFASVLLSRGMRFPTISKASDQPAHMHSLIRAFASRLNIL